MFRLNRRGKWLPTICRFGDGMVQMRLGGSGRTQINQMVSRQHGRQRAKSRFIATILLLGSGLRVSNYRRRAECAPRPPSERRRSRPPHGTAVGGNQTHLPASATNEVVELGTVACICVCEWVVADVKGLHAAFNGIERRRESSDRRISDVVAREEFLTH